MKLYVRTDTSYKRSQFLSCLLITLVIGQSGHILLFLLSYIEANNEYLADLYDFLLLEG